MHGKDLTESEDQFTVTDVLLLEISMLWLQKHLQVESYEDEALTEYTLTHPMSFKEVVECVVNSKKMPFTKENLALSNTKIENWFTEWKKNGLYHYITSFIAVARFD